MPYSYPNLRALAEEEKRWRGDPPCRALARALLAVLDVIEGEDTFAALSKDLTRLAALESEADRG